jgi:hypothetical protein
LDKSGAAMGFEALDDALVLWLDMCGEVWLEVFNLDVLKVGRNNMARKVILKEEYFSILLSKFTVLIELSSHPSLRIILVVKPQLHTGLLVESLWPCCFPNNKSWEFL